MRGLHLSELTEAKTQLAAVFSLQVKPLSQAVLGWPEAQTRSLQAGIVMLMAAVQAVSVRPLLQVSHLTPLLQTCFTPNIHFQTVPRANLPRQNLPRQNALRQNPHAITSFPACASRLHGAQNKL